MTGNIIGEEFDDFVRDQINIRQSNQFGGYKDILRTPEQLQYLNNRNAWVKLASSVSVLVDTITGVTLEDFISSKLKKINIPNPENYLGTQLAEKAVLFNSLSSYIPSSGSFGDFRAGISNDSSLWNNSAYGLGGVNYGLQPPPGIINVQVDSLNRGSIRKANITLKAHNKFQFDIIELLYLRLGFTMMLEWGWDKYLDNMGQLQDVRNTIIEDRWFKDSNTSQLDMLKIIEEMKLAYAGNYDGFFGKVSNFTWNFNPDGSYDISIDLITLGDVIESLKVNIFSKAQVFKNEILKEEDIIKIDNTLKDTNISKAATLNSIGSYLYQKINEISKQGINRKSGIRVLEDPTDKAFLYIMIPPSPNFDVGNQYYVKLGEFLARLETLVVPQIQNGSSPPQSQIIISHILEENLISYFPNQVSLDPKVCIFRPFLNVYGDITGINYPDYLSELDQYVTYNKTDTFGLLMNIYINFDFISELLLTNGNLDQELSLYKFLSDLCNSINRALGGVNKLEPIIKDDYIITIIDQTFSLETTPEINLEIYGYNSDNQTSNFVKDIRFQSKITPQLASMISIGATAAGSSTSEIDGTAFSKWSEGLVDRFTEKILEPEGFSKLNVLQEINEETLRKEYNNFPDAINTRERILMRIFETGRWAKLKASGDLNLKRINNSYYEGINGRVMSFDKFYSAAIDEINKQRSKGVYLPEDILNLTNKNYAIWLVNAFGGVLNDIKIAYPIAANTLSVDSLNINTPRYLEYNNTFIQQGKGAYQNYLNILNNSRYKETNIPSSEIGFIPLSFDLTLDGISGIKIYNKLNINNEFLPSNYPESLKFIITKVNHTISNNSWDTSLSTISIPVTKPYKFNPSANSSNNINNINNSEDIKSSYPDIPLLDPPPSTNLLPYEEAVRILKSITNLNLAKAVFAVMIAESSKKGNAFSSAGGYNYAGVQTDTGRWGASVDKYIIGRFRRRDAKRVREFAAFNSNQDFLEFMINRIGAKGFDGGDGDSWTSSYICNWWWPTKCNEYKKGTAEYNNKLAIYNTAIKIFNQY